MGLLLFWTSFFSFLILLFSCLFICRFYKRYFGLSLKYSVTQKSPTTWCTVYKQLWVFFCAHKPIAIYSNGFWIFQLYCPNTHAQCTRTHIILIIFNLTLNTLNHSEIWNLARTRERERDKHTKMVMVLRLWHEIFKKEWKQNMKHTWGTRVPWINDQ